LSIRIIFQNDVMTGGYPRRLHYCTPQFKTDPLFALPAKRKPITPEQRGLVHQAVRIVRDTIDAVFRHHFPWSVLFSDCLPLLGQYLPLRPKLY